MTLIFQVKVKVMLRPTFSRLVYLGVKPPTRGRYCRLQMLLALASAVILGSECRGTHDNILRSQIRDLPNLEGQVPVFTSPRKRVTQLYPPALGSLFVASYDSQGYGGGIRTHLHTGLHHVSLTSTPRISSYLTENTTRPITTTNMATLFRETNCLLVESYAVHSVGKTHIY
jgi:hypothetical protein